MQYLKSLKENVPGDIKTAISSITSYISSNKTKCAFFSGLPAFFCLRYVYIKLSNKSNKLPPGPIGWPLIGSAYSAVIQKKMDWEYYMSCTYGVVSSYKVFGTNFILISDAKIAKKLISKKDVMDRFYKPGQWHIFGVGEENTIPLLWLDGNDWISRRRLIQNTLIRLLTNSKVNDIVGARIKDTFAPYLDSLCNENENWIYQREMIAYLTFNSIYGSCFDSSLQMGDEKYKNIAHSITNTMNLVATDIQFRVLPFMKYFQPSQYEAMIEFRKWRNDFFKELLFQKREKYNKNNLLSIVDHFYYLIDRNEMTENECVAELFILFLAGMDTTTNSISFGIFLVAKYPDIIKKIREELKNVFEKDIDLRKINKCPMLRSFVYETLRISSVIRVGFPHTSKQDQEIEDYTNGKKYVIPKGSVIQYYVDYIQRIGQKNINNTDWIDIGDEICLENWLKKDENDKYYFQINQSFINFGCGRRDCVGKSLAVKEMCLVLGYLILNYDLSLVDTDAEIERYEVGKLMQIKQQPIKIKQKNI